MTKKEIRECYLDRRKKMSKDDVINRSMVIYNKIITSELYKECNELFIYVSNFNEVDTIKIIEKAWEDNKTVAVPKVEKKGIIKFYYINSTKDLRKGKFNILEPSTLIEAVPSNKTLFIMPGVVFDKTKNRIGFGGGYYDRYLFKYREVFINIAICYDYQLLDMIPSDVYDVKPDYIFTELQVI
ncbi:5-formyltetrahydrofolate cyclo-ligase [Vallitalea longa]|uniref:5-formyltetrahydrofolate cyclo-ligase n=1 Tax=Vallitalea longa TaxID=2936439 RepID=A0A9W5YBH9_9FIRM|nr:5-formyltetrahydrofolate cyclo-ligase [Vallitalea longa]GKX30059.1 5-formyltetrahydrofolate cyclo-ligase [Vallitalea longa]